MTVTRRSTLAGLLAGATFAGLPILARAEGTLDDIKKRGTIRLGVTQAPPWYSKDPKTGEWTSGLGIFMGKAMAQTLGVKLEPVEVSWGNAIAALQGSKIDLMFVIDATAERKQAVDFPESPLLYYSLAVLARDDLKIKAWEDLNKAGLKISCAQATTIEAYVTKNLPKAEIQKFPGNQEAIAAFQSGRVDAVAMFHPPLLAAKQKLGKGQLVVPTPPESVPSSTAARKGDTAFVAWLDKTTGDYYRSGQSEKWYEQALADFGLDPKTVPPIMKEMMK
jgi:polar amino acid transport system substrate-binding protein